MGDVNNRGGCACVEAEDTWKIAVLSPQFCYESKMALKIKSLRKKKKSYLGPNHTEQRLGAKFLTLNSTNIQETKIQDNYNQNL